MNLWMGVIAFTLGLQNPGVTTDRSDLCVLSERALYTSSVDGKLQKKCDVTATQLEWSADGRVLLVFDAVSGHVWTLASGTSELKSLAESASFATIDREGKRVLIGYKNASLSIVDVLTGSDTSYRVGTGSRCAAWSPDGKMVSFANDKDIWMASSDGKIAFVIAKDIEVQSMAWSPNGKIIACATKDTVLLLEVAGGRLTNPRALQTTSLQWSPDSKYLLCSTANGSEVWDAMSGSNHANPSGYQRSKWFAVGKVIGLKDNAVYAFSGFNPKADARLLGRIDAGQKTIDAVVRPSAQGFEALVTEPDESTLLMDESLLRATVSSVDLTTGAVKLDVDSVRFRNGQDVFFGHPSVTTALLGLKGSNPLTSRNGHRWLSAQDVKKGLRVWAVAGPLVEGSDTIDLRGFLLPRMDRRNPENPSRGKLSNDGADLNSYVVPLIFPVLGGVKFSDTFLNPRDGGRRRHMGQDLMAKKMRPLIAAFDGVVRIGHSGNGGNSLTLTGDNGWTATYMHINNDMPGTDDGKATIEYAFAPGLKSGDRVVAGQLVAFVGDSGNAESTASHVHFELNGGEANRTVNAAPSLQQAVIFEKPVARYSMTQWTTESGETRLDGFVQSINETTGSVVIDVSCTAESGSTPTAVTFPQRKMIVLDSNLAITVCGSSSLTVKLADLKPGMPIVVVGRVEPTGLQARLVGVELPKLVGDTALLSALKAAGTLPAVDQPPSSAKH